MGDPPERVAQGGEVGDVEPTGVDATHAARDDAGARGCAQHERVELLATGLGLLLRVVEASERAALGQRQALEVEEHRGGDERARQRPPPRLVGTGYEAAPQRAVEREELATRIARAALRAARSGRAASR